MSVKREYDLDKCSQLTGVADGSSVDVGQDVYPTDIDIKYEYPYQSVQFSLKAQQHDTQHPNNLISTQKDPLKCKLISIRKVSLNF